MRKLATGLLAAAALLLVPAPATAGGPTSVLITDPELGEATALYYNDSAYSHLDQLLQDGERLASPPSGSMGAPYNLTWMIHDVSVWRTDEVFMAADGGPVVKTVTMDWETGEFGAESWLRLDQGVAVQQLLDGSFAGTGNALAATPRVVEKVVTESRTEWFSLEGWRWALPGLLVGLCAGLVSRGRRREDGPRRTLVDLAPDRVPVP